MSISSRHAPLSPISVGGSEWSTSKYHADDGGFSPQSRGNLASPPISGGFNGNMSMSGFPNGPGGPGPGPGGPGPGGPRLNGAPSPPASVAGRSSMGGAYARSESARNSTREIIDDSVLNEHYQALKIFLQTRDPNAKAPPNKARDKLLRLSSVQFYELSTDVYDELRRRQTTARTPPNAPNMPPAFLLPEKTFHPKRNQARQRLSSLGPPRFRDLAADVFHELERRFPRFVGGDIPRGNSSMSMRGPPMRNGTPVNGGNGYPRGPRMRQPSDAGSMRGPPPLDAYGVPPSPGLPPGDFGRPMQKQLNQNNTIVPNKSTMVEDDDDGEDSDAYGMGRNRESKRSAESSETDKKLIDDYQNQVRELREKLDGMEDVMKKREDEMNAAADADKKEWANVRQDLEDKLASAQNLNDSIKEELNRVRDEHEEDIRQLRIELQSANAATADSDVQRENDELRNALQEQRRITDEVRREAQEHLREMRMLSQQSGSTYEKQLQLEKAVEQLEADARHWKSLYARTKTQLRNMRASSIGLSIDQEVAKMVQNKGFISDRGVIKDVHVTKFQMAIDEVLQRARTESPEKVIDAMKSVVVSVRRITREVDQAPPTDEAFAQQKGKLKARVSAAANNFITCSKNFALGAGMSPVSLVDASASHLTAAMVELLRGAKIRPTPAEELEEDEDDGSVTPAESAAFFSPRSTTLAPQVQDTLPPPRPFQGLGGLRVSADSSAYSPISSPRESVEPHSRRGTNGMGYGGYNKGPSPMTNGYLDDKSSSYYDL